MQTCASPQYIQTHGIPQHPEQLAKFSTIFFSSMAGRRNWKFKTLEGGYIFDGTEKRYTSYP